MQLLKTPRVLAVIPARGGSKSIPHKNIVEIDGYPLIAYSIIQALNSRYITDLVVSTDSSKIAEVSKEYGAQVPFLRPGCLATDASLTSDVIHHSLIFMENKSGQQYDYVITLQPTTPMRSSYLIDRSIEVLEESSDYDSVISVVDVGAYHPRRMYTISSNNILSRLIKDCGGEMAPRQELEPIYIRSGDIYLVRAHLLRQMPVMIGTTPYGLLVHPEETINIDEQRDLDYARLKVKWPHS